MILAVLAAVLTNTDEVRACTPELVGTAGGLVHGDHVLTAADGLPGTRIDTIVPDGARAWVSAEAGGNVTVIDVATDSVLAQFPIRDGKTKPVRIAFSPDGRLAYITEGAGASVSIVDVARQTVIDSIAVGRRPWGIALSPDGSRLYTADGRSDQVSVLDTKSRKVIATIKTGERPNDLLYIP